MQVLVDAKRKERGLSKRQLARLAHINRQRLRRRLEHPQQFTLAELAPCCQVLGVSICQVVIFDPPPANDPEEKTP